MRAGYCVLSCSDAVFNADGPTRVRRRARDDIATRLDTDHTASLEKQLGYNSVVHRGLGFCKRETSVSAIPMSAEECQLGAQ